MNHYVCLGDCGGQADDPGVCKNPTCSQYEQELRPCMCEDGRHQEKLTAA
ncbi:MAG: hypothetical protein ACOCU8_02565 [Patescibacteria group bacterium]